MAALTDTYAGRIIAWRMPSVRDDRRFAFRDMTASPDPVELPASKIAVQAAIGEHTVSGIRVSANNLQEFLAANGTTSFLVIRAGTMVFERYFADAAPDMALAAFSVSKSFLGALIGIALDRGMLGSVEDAIIQYVPELADHGYGAVRLKHLLSMSEGLRYSRRPVPWSGHARAYYAPDRWATVMAHARLTVAPGTAWNYNDYAPTIIGVALQRVSGQPLAEFAKAALLDPLGMPHDARWTLDSPQAGLENAAAGLYATARTLAAFGQAHLDGGRVDGREVIPAAWIEQATAIRPTDPPALRNVRTEFFSVDRMSYKYLWWVKERTEQPGDFVAIGNFGQFVYCSPAAGTVIVRTGRKWGRFGATNWLTLLDRIAHLEPSGPGAR